ncbi:MAG: hypothetical protein IKB16_08105 [Lentisphaeria bacterium]|nr:hypothetical protein [Lentisphaeria bacterium]
MKKVLIVFAAVLTSISLCAENVNLGFWKDAPKGNGSKNIEGVAFGLPVSAIKSCEGAQISLFGNLAKEAQGVQATFIVNHAKKFDGGLQFGAINLSDNLDDISIQWGTFNHSGKDGIQLGFVNNCSNNAKFQLGFININKNGFFPVMIFVNFGKDLFD